MYMYSSKFWHIWHTIHLLNLRRFGCPLLCMCVLVLFYDWTGISKWAKRLYVSNIFCHWRRPCLGIDRRRVQTSPTLCLPRQSYHDDVIKWKYFLCYRPFVRGIHRPPINSHHKGQWRRALNFFYLRLNKRSSKQSWGWWFQTAPHPLRRHCNVWCQAKIHGPCITKKCQCLNPF